MVQTALPPSWYSLPSQGSLPADVQILVRGPCKHHPSASVANCGRKAICRSIERPCDHPVRAYWDSGTGFIRRIGVASLCGAAQHINHPGRCVRWLRLSLHGIHHPSHTHGFMHMGGSPILFSFPGVQTHSFVPWTRTVMVPSAAISATVASLVTCSGPERRALLTLGSSALSVMS